MKFITALFLVALVFSQNLNSTIPADQIHPAIVIGAGIAGIASSKQLTSRNIPHLILEARNRIGGRIVSDTLEGVQVDLGASFVHNPLVQNAIDSLIQEMGWSTVPARFYLIEEYFKSGKELTADENIQAQKLYKEFQTYI
jgi:monoamine oxidase